MDSHEGGDYAGWTPQRHIDSACHLLETYSRKRWTEGESFDPIMTPMMLTEAQVHLAVAEAKMHGRMRA